QHLSQLSAGYGIVRTELGRRQTVNDAVGVAEVDVAFRPVAAVNVGEYALAFESRSVSVAAVPDSVDHLRSLSASDRCVGCEGAVRETFDYAQRSEHINGLSLRNVSLIRECRTGK